MAPTPEILRKARAAADRVLQLDPNAAEAHTARGLVVHELEWDQARAEPEFRRAVELKPNYAYGIHGYGIFWNRKTGWTRRWRR
jgi:Tfp pilus assembly protein PilF